MSGIDERLKRELDRATVPVATGDVLERVTRRRLRRRRTHRIGIVVVAVAVLAGTVAGGFGLTRLFAHPGSGSPAAGGGGASPTIGAEEGALCDESQLNADLDGDGTLDQVTVSSPSTASSCDPMPADVGRRYMLQVSGGKLAEDGHDPSVRFYGVGRELPECTRPFACRLFAAPDLNGDGEHEVAVQIDRDGELRRLTLYRLEPSGAGFELVRMSVQDDASTDPSVFLWGSSQDRTGSLECRQVDGERWLVASTAQPSAQTTGTWDVREMEFSVHGAVLKLEAKADYPAIAKDSNPPFVMPKDLCGAPIRG